MFFAKKILKINNNTNLSIKHQHSLSVNNTSIFETNIFEAVVTFYVICFLFLVLYCIIK